MRRWVDGCDAAELLELFLECSGGEGFTGVASGVWRSWTNRQLSATTPEKMLSCTKIFDA